MSHRKQLQEKDEEIGNLKRELKKANEKIAEYQKRDTARVGDNVRVRR